MSQYPPVPPTEGLALPEAPPGWPKVIGIISTIWGGFNLLCGGLGFVFTLFMPSVLPKMMPPEMGPPPPAMMPSGAQLVLMGLGLAAAALLLVAGITTLMRRPAGRTLHLGYAVFSLLITIPAVVLMVQQQAALADWAAGNPDNAWAKQQSPLGSLLGFCFVGLGVAYTIFLLAWFLPAKHSPEVGAVEVV